MALDNEAFTWGAGGAQLTPAQLAAQRSVAQAMMLRGMDYSPVKSGWEGAARVAQALLGTADDMSAKSQETEGRRQAVADAVSAFGGGQPGSIPSTPTAAAAPAMAAPVAPARVDTSEKIYANDEPSPLDPPSGRDRDLAIRTVFGEAGNEPSEGQRAVAAVIRNRAVDGSYGGDTIPGVTLAKNQFEPWNGGVAKQRMLDLSPESPAYKSIGDQVDAAYGTGGRAPEDPTEGATHFYSPGGQAALGRQPPSWARGESTTIGGHQFFNPDDQPTATVPQPVRVASAMPFAPSDTAVPPAVQATSGLAKGPQGPSGAPPESPPAVAPGVQMVAQATPAAPATAAAPAPSAGVAQIMRALSNPHLPPAYATALQGQLTQMTKPRDQFGEETDAAGNIWSVNKLTGQRTVSLKKDASFSAPYRDDDGNLVQRGNDGKISVVSAADKTPTSVSEYNFYKKNFAPTEHSKEPMGYDAWSTAKARAAAININNTNNTGGGSDKQIFDAFDERAKDARAVSGGLVAIRNARGALDGAGGAITGAGAESRLAIQKIGSLFGVTDPAAIQNTETFRAAIAPQIASVLKSTVGTANISNSDRTFAEKAAGGSIDLDAGSIKRLLDIMEKASVARLQDHQEQLDAVYPDPVANKRERALFGIKTPTPSAPPAGATKSGIKWSVE